VPAQPQRPFVPHRTPKASPQGEGSSEFLVARPFIPGGASMPSIGEFLDARAEPRVPVAASAEMEDEAGDELPPVEHFTDPLPPVMAFAPDAQGALPQADELEREYASAEPEAIQQESGWLQEDWQQFDWRSAASLGDEPATEASNEWAKTDWEVSAPIARDRKPSAADAIANALDEIAQRIRKGELAVPAPDTLSNPAAIAASLAALLGVKR
jgi:hypothetical protein